MGVPKFFRYMSERYPCLSELVREEQIPDFDNLYLDMNGIIHPCSHPDDGNVHFRITEEAIFRAIFNYIDKLFFLIKPRKLFFMAVDGVAPRAKMNQQRSRRFRSAKEAETLEQNALAKGEKLPDTARFDSNCITPGTEFMVRLQAALKYFVKQKMSTNPLWQRCRIILSGHETPGEGEHKIMEYIRYMKSQPGYDVNTRHCLYGLDADLIVLGLCTHEMHFSLLREEVSFGKKAKKASVEETRFFLLHLNLLREYLELEFGSLKEIESRKFNIGRIIDDWILMGFLVGNDFIPHLPNLHINTNALPTLYDVYKKVWPEMSGYLNENGHLNLNNFELFMEELAKHDLEMFRDVAGDLKYFEGKRGANGMLEVPEAFDFDVNEMAEANFDSDLAKMIEESNNMFGSDEDLSDDEAMLEKEFTAHKRNYYISKLKYPEMTPEVLAEQTECYIRALQWILFYYYRGVSSWGWFYPHHYAPYASDVKNFRHLKLDFDIGKPFLPFEQLLAVLPAASKELLPDAFRNLMTHSDSEIIEYYPKNFETDLNGKKQEWEAVVLIPFIDEIKLLAAMSKRFPQLLPEEQDRNIHGPMLQYDYTSKSQGECEGVFSFKKIPNVYCTEKAVYRDEVRVSADFLQSQISKYPKRTCHLPGFPTMKHLNYTGELQRARVKVFDQPSRNDTMILLPEIKHFDELDEIAQTYLDKIVYVGWPHLVKSKVTALLTVGRKVTATGVEEGDKRLFEMHLKSLEDHTFNRMGIKFRDTNILVYVKTLASVEHVVGNNGKMNSTNIWSNSEISYPLQGIVMNIRREDECVESKIEDFYPVGTPVFMLSSPYFGCEGHILDPKLVYSCGRIQVNITVIPEPQLAEAREINAQAELHYYNTYEFSLKVGLPANIIARITGCVFIIHGAERGELVENTPKTNVGLNLKSKRTDQQVAGYVRKKGTTWEYSEKTMNLLISYYEQFPEVFNLLRSCTNGKDEFYETDLFPPQTSEKKLSDITAWLKKQDYNNADRVPCNTKWVEGEAVEAIKKAVDDLKNQPVKCIKLQVKPHFLLRHGLEIPQAFKSKSKIRLFDRVVVVKKTYQVPVGYKGTVIAIHPMSDPNPVRIECLKQVEVFIEVLFDKELPDIGDENEVELKRVARVAENSVLVVYQPLDEHIIVPVENAAQSNTRNLNKTDVNCLNEIQRNASDDSMTKQNSKDDSIPFFANNRNVTQPPPRFPETKPDRKSAYNRTNTHNSNISTGGFVQPPTSSGPVPKILRNNAANFVCPPAQSQPVQSRTFTNSQKIFTSKPKETTTKEASYKPVVKPDDLFANITAGVGGLNLKQVSPNVVDSTEALRKLLGVATASENPHDTSPSTTALKQYNTINFPKPPSNWTKEASNDEPKRKDMSHFLMPAFSQRPHHQPIPVHNVQPNNSTYFPQSTTSNQPIQVDMKYHQPPVVMSQQYNNLMRNEQPQTAQTCPSRGTRVNNISSGPSAFIPLQVMRSTRKQEPKDGNAKFHESSRKNPQENIPHMAANHDTPDSQNKGQTSQNPTEDDSTIKVKPAAQPKIRKPKIAANFNFKA